MEQLPALLQLPAAPRAAQLVVAPRPLAGGEVLLYLGGPRPGQVLHQPLRLLAHLAQAPLALPGLLQGHLRRHGG